MFNDCLTSVRTFCDSEYARLLQCATQTPVLPPIFVPPPGVCPAGQHLNEGECEEDPECGDDEIAGEDGTCSECGEGEVPGDSGEKCVKCDWGESQFKPGQCVCDAGSLDALASQEMGNIPDDPWEVAGTFECPPGAETPSVHKKTISTEHEKEKCILDLPEDWALAKVAVAHSHPVFAWPRDENKICMRKPLQTELQVFNQNSKNMGHSQADMHYAKSVGLPSYLSDSYRVLYVYGKDAEGAWVEEKMP